MNAESLPLMPSTEQRAKMAYVYIRQSSLMQVTRHAESTDLQYSLVERAVALGWPRERVELIADGERLYDPRLYHGRLLLGLSGMMSEAELHHLKQRMHTGARNKAERGEL